MSCPILLRVYHARTMPLLPLEVMFLTHLPQRDAIHVGLNCIRAAWMKKLYANFSSRY